MEALAIAVAMREARHLGKSAALVTPDRALARRVMAALGRWNLDFDDSGGDALTDTPAGIFARLAAEAAARQIEPPTLLALLKHPLCRLGGAPGAFAGAVEGSNWRCCAALVRSREAAAWRATLRAFAMSSPFCGPARPVRCTAPSRGRGSTICELDQVAGADRANCRPHFRRWKISLPRGHTILPNSPCAIAACWGRCRATRMASLWHSRARRDRR